MESRYCHPLDFWRDMDKLMSWEWGRECRSSSARQVGHRKRKRASYSVNFDRYLKNRNKLQYGSLKYLDIHILEWQILILTLWWDETKKIWTGRLTEELHVVTSREAWISSNFDQNHKKHIDSWIESMYRSLRRSYPVSFMTNSNWTQVDISYVTDPWKSIKPKKCKRRKVVYEGKKRLT